MVKKSVFGGIRSSHLLPALLSVGLALSPAAAEARSCGGVDYPEVKALAGKKLVLNGMGIREATVLKVDVYVAGLYVENRSSDGVAIARSAENKQMVLTLVRDVDAKEMNEAIENGFKKNAGGNFAKLSARVDKLKAAMPDLKDKDVVEFSYVPAQGLEIRVNGKARGNIEGADFATTFLLVWLGDNPPNADLKKGLLGGPCG